MEIMLCKNADVSSYHSTVLKFFCFTLCNSNTVQNFKCLTYAIPYIFTKVISKEDSTPFFRFSKKPAWYRVNHNSFESEIYKLFLSQCHNTGAKAMVNCFESLESILEEFVFFVFGFSLLIRRFELYLKRLHKKIFKLLFLRMLLLDLKK